MHTSHSMCLLSLQDESNGWLFKKMWSHGHFFLWFLRNKGWHNFPTGTTYPTLPQDVPLQIYIKKGCMLKSPPCTEIIIDIYVIITMGFHMKLTLNRTDRYNKYTHAHVIYVKSIHGLLKHSIQNGNMRCMYTSIIGI